MIDWDDLDFSLRETDVIYRAEGDRALEPVWGPGEFVPYGPVSLSPAAAFFSYGVGIFEGLKAHRARDDRILLFRHADNARRFQRSAERLYMPTFPAERFTAAVEALVARNARFVPPHGKGAFYVRPLQHAVEPKLGLVPSRRFWVLIFGSPVGNYFGADAPVGLRLRVLDQGRVAPGGTGAAKAMGNYAGGIAVAHHWKQRGYDDVLYLDARHGDRLTETSGSNVFVRTRDGKLVTPPLDDQILAGVTRDSAIRVAREMLEVEVEARPITIEETFDSGVEVFATGTAWTVQSIRELVHHDRTRTFDSSELQESILDVLRGIQTGERDDPYGWVAEVPVED
jgi:branched-chain amino acid aminotransferase